MWADKRERSIGESQSTTSLTLHSAMRRYANDESSKKRGARNERARLKAFESLLPDIPMRQVTQSHIAAFRDSRLKVVKPASVLRDMNLLSSFFTTAMIEWKAIDENPCKGIRRPKDSESRRRTISPWETERMLRALGYSRTPTMQIQALAIAFLLAMRTGMRQGEICSLTWADIHADYAHLARTKNGSARDVPLSTKARRLVSMMRGYRKDYVFGMKPALMSALFRKYRRIANLSGFTFHDTRHTAATMLCRKVDALTLCKIFGWKNTKMALTYYNPTPASIAAMLG